MSSSAVAPVSSSAIKKKKNKKYAASKKCLRLFKEITGENALLRQWEEPSMTGEIKRKIAQRKAKNIKNNLPAEQIKKLIKRVTGSQKYSDHFIIEPLAGKTGYDRFRLLGRNGRAVIQATGGVAACAAFNHYLKEYCGCFFGPITENRNLPEEPPLVKEPVERESTFLYRYFMNYCTFSYTYLFSGWEDYERLTDWMLLSGVNLCLNIVGHEIVWRDVLQELGYSREDIDRFLCGPAYLPWQWMGNMTGFGGNLPVWWYEKQKQLSNRINDKLRGFGAEVVLPGYFGMVPSDFEEKYPQAAPIAQGDWCGAFERPSLLEPKDVMFDRVADLFYAKTREHFGDCHYYSGDPFHEGGKREGIDLKAFGQGVIAKMKQHAPDGVWFLQGWQDNPQREMLQALEKTDILIGGLSADNNYSECDDFCGYPWLYLSTPNFGGTRKMSGNVKGFLSEPLDILEEPDKHAVAGIGMAMEGVELDEIIYDVFSSISFAQERISTEQFIGQFVKSRYGFISESCAEAFRLLVEHVYTRTASNLFGSKESSLCTRPSLEARNVSTWGTEEDVPYDERLLLQVIGLLMKEYDRLKGNECYRLDLMDIARQAIADRGWQNIAALRTAYEQGDKALFVTYKENFLALFDVQEKLTETNRHTLLGRWLEKAQNYGTAEDDRRLFSYNAKNLITLWASKDGSVELRDYAHREWSGMIKNFYKKRWQAYLNLLELFFYDREAMPSIDWKEFEYVFVLSEESYRTEETGDLKTAVTEAMACISVGE